jgi:lipopolysaccharide transport system permease protein
MANLETKENWSLEIQPKASYFDFKLREFWQYRDLIILFVKRELVPTYKQTILGPLWFVLQPLLTTLVYSIIFGAVARIPTDGLPQLLFYMPGIVLWNFFNSAFMKSSGTFIANTHIFGKVYFPRLILPVSGLISSFVNFLIQLGLFLFILLLYYFNGTIIHPGWHLLLSPVILFMVSLYSLGLGMMISAFTTRYKDLSHLLAFGSQLLMYATPIIYPASIVPEKFKWVNLMNPLSPIFEAFRYSFLGIGQFMVQRLVISFVVGLFVFLIGLMVFNKAERTSIDTV